MLLNIKKEVCLLFPHSHHPGPALSLTTKAKRLAMSLVPCTLVLCPLYHHLFLVVLPPYIVLSTLHISFGPVSSSPRPSFPFFSTSPHALKMVLLVWNTHCLCGEHTSLRKVVGRAEGLDTCGVNNLAQLFSSSQCTA